MLRRRPLLRRSCRCFETQYLGDGAALRPRGLRAGGVLKGSAIVVEPGNAHWAILDYIHLNPVRAGLVAGRDGMESYAWSSLPLYLKEPWERPDFLETVMGV